MCVLGNVLCEENTCLEESDESYEYEEELEEEEWNNTTIYFMAKCQRLECKMMYD